MPPDLSVCVPVYRAHEPPNLATLAASLPAALDGLTGELVVALNGITAAEAGVPADVRTVDMGVNRGVAPGWNAAAGAASAPVLVFANDDVVPGPGSLRVLHDALMGSDDVGLVGAVGSCWQFEQGAHQYLVELAGRAPGELVPCDVVGGYLFAGRRSTWEAVGRFDEFYAPCSWEEIDFCAAVRIELGLRCYAVAGVDHEHEWGVSRPQRPWKRMRFDGRSESIWSIHRRNRRHFLSKWSERAAAAR